ncbi:hypothetical protein [Nakamurella leprariae]|uniref:Uncharacterized protein n=1 Tax=Nakamurella leprariae TaxID=2803911 RepID=A0A938Y6H3_9ACTN|nr:hypothetical protein [Nakamurella leprariae]MBM9466680.1 hypothetical protein [Nakamurella leprariae]
MRRLGAVWTVSLLALLSGCAGAGDGVVTVTPPVGAGPWTAEDAARAWDLALDDLEGPPLLITDLQLQQLGDWPDGEEKQASLDGAYTLQDPASAVDPAPRSIALGSSSRVMRVLSAAETVELMRAGQGGCGDGCAPLTLTDPMPVDMEVVTVLGPTTVPGWEFTVAGTEVRLQQVAVDPAEFLAVETFPDVDPSSPATSAEVLADGTVRLSFIGNVPADSGPCGNDYSGGATEFERVVVVRAVGVPNEQFRDMPDVCDAAAGQRAVDIHLERPLADPGRITPSGLPRAPAWPVGGPPAPRRGGPPPPPPPPPPDRVLITPSGLPVGITGRTD